MIRRLHLFLKERRGNAAIEFAFVLPIMMLLMGGIVEFGRFFQVYNGINRLATRYASVYSDCNDTPSGTCNIELALYYPAAAIKNIAPQLTNGTPVVRMFQVTYSTSSVLTINYSYPLGATMTSTETQAAQNAISLSGSQETGVVVTVYYLHKLNFFPSVVQYFANSSTVCPSSGNPLCVSYTVAQRKT